MRHKAKGVSYYKQISLLNCPSCGSKAYLIDTVDNKAGLFGRVICSENRWPKNPESRCYMKTTAGPIDRVIKIWNTRDVKPQAKYPLFKDLKVQGKYGVLEQVPCQR